MMSHPDLTDAEQAIEDFISTAEAMEHEVTRPDRDASRAVELARLALDSAQRWQAAEAADREATA